MPDFPIDPELRIRASPPVVLRRTTEAVGFIRKMTLSRPGHAWRDVLQSFQAALERVERDGSRGPPRTASRGGRPADRGENSARFCPRARSVSRRLDRSRAMLARCPFSPELRGKRGAESEALHLQLAKL